jgi:YVTN family beta-propeller protein
MESDRLFRSIAAALLLIGCQLDAVAALAQKAYLPDGVDNLVSVVDTATGAVTGTFTVNGGNPADPGGVAVTPDGSTAYVTLSARNSVVPVMLATGAAGAPIAVGVDPVAVAIARDGRAAYVANSGGNSVSVIDLASGSVASTIVVGNRPSAIALTPDGSKAFVANGDDASVSVIDTASGAVLASIGVGVNPDAVAIAPDGSKAFVGALGSSDGYHPGLSIIDIATGTVSATLYDGYYTGVAVSPNGSEVYALGNAYLVEYNAATGARVNQFYLPVSTLAVAVTPDGRALYLTQGPQPTPTAFGSVVYVFDTATSTITDAIAVGAGPTAVAITPDGTRAVVSDLTDGTLSILSPPAKSVLATVPLGPAWAQPAGVAFSPDGGSAYITDSHIGAVSVISTATDTVIATIAVGKDPQTVAFAPSGGAAYVANQGDGTVSVIDAASKAVTATIDVGGSPHGIAVTPDGRKAYVTDPVLGTVSVVQTATNSVMSSLAMSVAGPVVIAPDGRTAYLPGMPQEPQPRDPTIIVSVSAIDTATDTTLPSPFGATYLLGQDPGYGLLALSPDGSVAYLSDEVGFEVVDLRTGAILSQIVDTNPATGLAITPDGSKIYLPSGDASGAVSVIDTATGTVSTITVGTAPGALGNFIAPVPSPLASAVLPGSRTVQTGTTATVFATMLNSGASAVANCAIGLDASAPASLVIGYQTTDPTTNALTGTPNTPVAVAAGGAQSFMLSFQSSVAIADPGQPLTFTCPGVPPASILPGVNTVDLGFSATPTEDIIALAATAPQPGIVTIPYSTEGGAAFAVATFNAGASGTLTVSADTGSAALPLTASLCPTDPSTAQCLQPPAGSFQQDFAANATPTFSVFLTASGPIAFAPGTSRIFVRFEDAAGTTHGSTSVAVDTD